MARKILAVVLFIAVMTALAQLGWWLIAQGAWWAIIPLILLFIALAIREDRRVGNEHPLVVRLRRRLFGWREGP
jgi:hypothetical protein